VVYTHNPVSSFLVRYACRKIKSTKVIYMAHGFHFVNDDDSIKKPYLIAEKIAGAWTDSLIVMNTTDLEMAKTHDLIEPNRLSYVPGVGIDLSQYDSERFSESDRESYRSQWGVGEDEILFVSVAALHPRKGHINLLKAISNLSQENWRLLLVGEGALLGECRKCCVEFGIADKVHFLGFRKDVDKIIWASDIAVLASVREGLPRFVMEALAMQKKIVGTNIRGTRDLVGDSDGYVCESGDIGDLTRVLELAYADLKSGDQSRMQSHADKTLAELEIGSVTQMQAKIIEDAVSET